MSEIIIDLPSYMEGEIKMNKDLVLKEIFNDYYDRIYKFFIYRTNNSHISEELTSTVFEKLVVNIDNYKGDTSNFNAWIFTIARNTMYDYFRSDKSKYNNPIGDYENILIADDNIEKELSQKENKKDMLQMLDILTDRERNIVSYKFGGGLQNVEIAEIMNLSATNVGSILHRSLKKLKKSLEEEI